MEFEDGRLPFLFLRNCEKEYHELIKLSPSDPSVTQKAQELINNFDKIWNHFRHGGFTSKNEEIDEYSNSLLKFFLVPYYAGRLHLLFQGRQRPAHLEAAVAYLTAFSDEMTRFRIVQEEPPEPTNPNDRRNRTVNEYKQRKELEQKLQRMNDLTKAEDDRGQIGDYVDAELEREVLMDLLKLSVLEARVHARAAKEELPFALMHAQGVKPEEPKEPPRKLWFQRIDRNEIRKNVFAPLEELLPKPLPPDDETWASPGKPKPDPDTENEEEREQLRKEASKWDDYKDDHPPFSLGYD